MRNRGDCPDRRYRSTIIGPKPGASSGVAVIALFAGLLATPSAEAADARAPVTDALEARPNILLLVGDDMGTADVQPFGSEIQTPTLMRLAESGMRFSNFHVSPVCSVTRAQLLTGNNTIEVGLGSFDYAVYPDAAGKPGYEGYLTRNTATIAEILHDAGYNTYHTGKWHLGGQTGGYPPQDWGFQETFGVYSGGSNHWNARDMIANPNDPAAKKAVAAGEIPPLTYSRFFENGTEVARTPGIFSDDLYTGKMIEYIESGRDSGRPFFGYLAFTTAHFPIQAPSALIDKYVDQYRELGFEGLKRQRHESLIKNGIYPEGTPFPSQNELTSQWNDLSEERREEEARTFATFAAMVESQDFYIGRILDYLRETGELDDTLVIYLTDNGPEGADAFGILGNKQWTDWIKKNFSMAPEDIGDGNTNAQIGMEWANAATGSLQWWKWFIGEGGIRVPLIIRPPASREVAQPGALSDTAFSVKDIPATILEYAGVPHPGAEFHGRALVAPSGVSAVPVLEGQSANVRSKDQWFGFELFGNAFVIQGDYKLIRVREGMYGDGQWHLYNTRTDPGEMKPLESAQPDRTDRMKALYDEYAKKHGIVPVAEDWNPFLEAGH